MMKINIIIIVSCLSIGCNDLDFDYLSKSSNSNSHYNMIYGELVKCTNDEQCGYSFSCIKDSDNLMGVCAQIPPK